MKRRLQVLFLFTAAVTCVTLLKAATPASASPPMPDNVTTVVNNLTPKAYLAGRKDLSDTMEPLKLGWAIYDMAEGAGAYSGIIEQYKYAYDQGTYDDGGEYTGDYDALTGYLTTNCMLVLPFESIDPPIHEQYMTAGDVFCNYYPALYDRCYINFDNSFLPDTIVNYCSDLWEDYLWTGTTPARVTTGDPCDPFNLDDSGQAFENANVNWYMFQGSVFSPVATPAPMETDVVYVPGSTGEMGEFEAYTFQDYPNFTDDYSQDSNIGDSFSQNIGFANNDLYPAGEFTYNFEHPLVSKYPVRDWMGCPEDPEDLDPCADLPFTELMPYYRAAYNMNDEITGGALQDTYYVVDTDLEWTWWPILSPLDPEVAGLVEAQIQDRIDRFSSKSRKPVYNMISGEYSFALTPGGINPFSGFPAIGYFWYSIYQATIGFAPSGVDPEYPSVPGTIADFCEYYYYLPGTDYSDQSKEHFREYLEAKYTNIAGLQSEWGMSTSFDDFADVDPLDEYSGETPYWNVLLADWLEFQEHQDQQFRDFQYRVAKLEDPTGRMYLLAPVEEAMLRSDGVANTIYYGSDSGLAEDPLTPTAIYGMQAAAYGESFNAPLFELPTTGSHAYDFVDNPTMNGITGINQTEFTDTVPNWYRPLEHEYDDEDMDEDVDLDKNVPRRVMREFFATGLDSIGIEYWEVMGHWGSRFGDAAQLVEAIADESGALEDERDLMTPWRSPLVVHFQDRSEADDPVPTLEVLRALSEEGAQFQAFDRIEGLEDLWLSTGREVMVSAFREDLDNDLLDQYVDLVESSSALGSLYVYTDTSTLGSLTSNAIGSEVTTITTLPMDAEAYELLDGSSNVIGLIYGLELGRGGELDTDSADFLRDAEGVFAVTEAATSSGRTLLPVSAEVSGAANADIALTVSTDGLNFLLCVANTGATSHTVDILLEDEISDGSILDYEYKYLNSSNTWSTPASSLSLSLTPGESRMVYIGVDVSVRGSLESYYNNLEDDVEYLGGIGYDIGAAETALVQAKNFARLGIKDKALASFLRIRRMAFAKYTNNGSNGKVTLVDIDGNLLGGADYQVEYALYGHHRTAVGQTGTSGASEGVGEFAIDPGNLPAPWNFSASTPSYDSSTSKMLEINFQHPDYGTQSRIIVTSP